jgi:CheY-like chemotaxis protein
MAHILLVEDEAIVAKLIETVLVKIGHQVSRSAKAEEALVLFETIRPDLVIMDVRLKGPMTGIEALYSIRKNSEIPVIFTSGNSRISMEKETREMVNTHFLIKPIDLQVLAQMVADLA